MTDSTQTTTNPAPAETPAAVTTPVETAATGKAEPSLLSQGMDSATPSPEAAAPEAKVEPPPIFSPSELKLPEGVTLPEAVTGKLTELASEAKLGTEGVQKFVDLHMDLVKQAAEEPYQLWRETQKTWQEEIKSDKVFGGDKLNDTLKQIGSVLANPDLVDPGFREALDFTGAGNNPAVFRTMAKIAAALTEGKAVQGNPPAAASKDLASIFYPNLPNGA